MAGVHGLEEYADSSPIAITDPTGAVPYTLACEYNTDAVHACFPPDPLETTNISIPHTAGGIAYDWTLFPSAHGQLVPKVLANGSIISTGVPTCGASQCRYGIQFLAQPRYKKSNVWTVVDCTDTGNPDNETFYHYWHGVRCGSSSSLGYPMWQGPGTHDPITNLPLVDGSSSVYIGDPAHTRRVFNDYPLHCRTQNPVQLATSGWSATAWGTAQVIISHLDCWCSCGRLPR